MISHFVILVACRVYSFFPLSDISCSSQSSSRVEDECLVSQVFK